MMGRRQNLGRRAGLLSAVGVVVGAALIPAAAPGTLAPVATADGCISVGPKAGPRKTPVLVRGCGFWPHEKIEIFLGTSFMVASLADDRGGFGAEFKVPADNSDGAKNVTAIGVSSGRTERGSFKVLVP